MHESMFTSCLIGKDKQSGLGTAQRSLFSAFDQYYSYPAVLFFFYYLSGFYFFSFPCTIVQGPQTLH
jgi:hypothetical protein